MAPVTISDLIVYLGRTLTPGEIMAASVILDDVTAEAESVMGGRTVGSEATTETVVAIIEHPTRPVWVPLSRTPIESVSAVQANGAAVAAGGWDQERSGIWLRTWAWSTATTMTVTVTVTYTGGLGGSDAVVVKRVIRSRAIRILQKRADQALGTTGVSIEGYEAGYETEGWTDEELKLLRSKRGASVSGPRTDVPALTDLNWG